MRELSVIEVGVVSGGESDGPDEFDPCYLPNVQAKIGLLGALSTTYKVIEKGTVIYSAGQAAVDGYQAVKNYFSSSSSSSSSSTFTTSSSGVMSFGGSPSYPGSYGSGSSSGDD